MPNYVLDAETGALGSRGSPVPTEEKVHCVRCGVVLQFPSQIPNSDSYCDACTTAVAAGEPTRLPKKESGNG